MTTANFFPSAKPATPKSYVWVACARGILPLHSRPFLKELLDSRAHVAVDHDKLWADVS